MMYVIFKVFIYTFREIGSCFCHFRQNFRYIRSCNKGGKRACFKFLKYFWPIWVSNSSSRFQESYGEEKPWDNFSLYSKQAQKLAQFWKNASFLNFFANLSHIPQCSRLVFKEIGDDHSPIMLDLVPK